MSYLETVKKHVTKSNGAVSKSLAYEALSVTQNKLALTLRELTRMRNLLKSASNSAFLSRGLTTKALSSLPSGNIVNSSNVGALTGVLGASVLVGAKNSANASNVSKGTSLNFTESAGDIMSGKTGILDSLKAGKTVGVTDIPIEESALSLANTDVETIKTNSSVNPSAIDSIAKTNIDPSFNKAPLKVKPSSSTPKFGANFGAIAAIGGGAAAGLFSAGSSLFSGSNAETLSASEAEASLLTEAGGLAKLDTAADTAKPSILSILDTATESIKGDKSAAKASSAVTSDVCALVSALECCINNIIKTINEAGKMVVQAIKDTIKKIDALIKSITDKIDALIKILSDMIAALKRLIDELINAMKKLRGGCSDANNKCLCEMRI